MSESRERFYQTEAQGEFPDTSGASAGERPKAESMAALTLKIRKLRKPARFDPTATLIGHATITHADGESYSTGAWFGTDRNELETRMQAWFDGLVATSRSAV